MIKLTEANKKKAYEIAVVRRDEAIETATNDRAGRRAISIAHGVVAAFVGKPRDGYFYTEHMRNTEEFLERESIAYEIHEVN